MEKIIITIIVILILWVYFEYRKIEIREHERHVEERLVRRGLSNRDVQNYSSLGLHHINIEDPLEQQRIVETELEYRNDTRTYPTTLLERYDKITMILAEEE